VTKLFRKCADVTGGQYINFYNRSTVIDSGEKRKYFKFLKQLHKEPKDSHFFIHHHHGYPGLKGVYDELKKAKMKVQKDPTNKFYLFTSVREVLSFITSRVNYLRNHCKCNASFKRCMEIKTNHNYQLKYLLYNHVNNWRNDKLEISKSLVLKTLGIVDKIYTPQDINQLIPTLSRILQIDISEFWTDEKVNVSKKTFKMNPKEKKILKSVNKLDMWLYEVAENSKIEIDNGSPERIENPNEDEMEHEPNMSISEG
jgi:hypothetical protein